MFVDVEGGAVNIKIAVAAEEPGAAVVLVRALATRTPPEADGELCEPKPGGIRLLGFDWRLRDQSLETGEVAHPHVYAIAATATDGSTAAEWHALLHGADAVIRLGRRYAELEQALSSAAGVPVVGTDARGFEEAVRGIVAVVMMDAGLAATPSGPDAQAFVTLQCPWCLEAIEIAIEADLAGTFVQDCEVCCRPWAVTVSRDGDGDLQVDVDRA